MIYIDKRTIKRKEIKMYKTVKETAAIFGVKPLTIRRWITDGKLRAVKIVGSVRITDEEIERLKKGE